MIHIRLYKMTKKARDWSKMVIYKICCNDLNITDIYIGHTCNLVKRRNKHNNCCNNENGKYYNLKVYQCIRENGGWDNWSVIEIDKCPCLDFEEASKIERYYIETLNATLNMVIPSRTKKEWYENNKEILIEKAKDYRKNIKDIINERTKQYYYANKDKILETHKEKTTCECGCIITNGALIKHKKSQKHIKLVSGI